MNKKSVKKNIKTLILYSLSEVYHCLPNRKDENVVFFPFFGRLGDMVMFLDMLLEWKRILIEKQKKRVIFACRTEVWKLLESDRKSVV